MVVIETNDGHISVDSDGQTISLTMHLPDGKMMRTIYLEPVDAMALAKALDEHGRFHMVKERRSL